MKIGYFVKRFPYVNSHSNVSEDYARWCRTDGAANVAYHLAISMAKRKNYEVNVFTTSSNSKDSVEKYENITIYRHGTNFTIGGSYVSLKPFFRPQKCKVDILHAHGLSILSDIPALLYARKEKIPLIFTYHGDPDTAAGDFIHKIAISFYARYFLHKVLSDANTIICPSEHYIEESRFLGKYRDKIIVIPNGINLEDFSTSYSKEECRRKLNLPLNKNLVLFVGVLTQRKGPDVLVRAMPKIIEQVPDTKLIIVGRGKMRRELEELSKTLNVDEHIEFAGFVEESLKALYYKAADILSLPSVMTNEVFPIVLLEASASGLPMVVSDLDTLKCIIADGHNGIVARRGDENNLSDAIIYLLQNESIRKQMSKNALGRVKDYSWERITEETQEVYNNVLG